MRDLAGITMLTISVGVANTTARDLARINQCYDGASIPGPCDRNSFLVGEFIRGQER
jgi:hypothetical protein